MLLTMIQLRTLVELARLNLNISVKLALQITAIAFTVILGGTLALTWHINSLNSAGFVLIGTERVGRFTLILAACWVFVGVSVYAGMRSQINKLVGRELASRELGLQVLLGADVLSLVFVEWLERIFVLLLLAVVSAGALFGASLADILVLAIGGGVGTILWCRAVRKRLVHLAHTEKRKGRWAFIFHFITPLCLAAVVATGILGWRNTGEDIHIPQGLAVGVACLSVGLAAVEFAFLVRIVCAMRGRPLGLRVAYVSLPIVTLANGFFAPHIRAIMRVVVVRPFFAGLMATRWLLALMIVLAVVDIPSYLQENATWIVGWVLIVTLLIKILPDLLSAGRSLRFYYEERGGFTSIFVVALLVRVLAILPQTCVMIIFWHLVGGRPGGEVIALAALAVVGSMLAHGIAGSSHQEISEYGVMVAAGVLFGVMTAGTVLLSNAAPIAIVVFVIAALAISYTTWRKNLAYAP